MKIWGPPASKRSNVVAPRPADESEKCENTTASASDAPGLPIQKHVERRLDSSTGSRANLSDGALRMIRRWTSDPPVDLVLENPPLRSSADVDAVLTELSRSGAQSSVRTLTVGPWDNSSAFGHAPETDGADDALSDADSIVGCVLSHASMWSQWHLRSLSLADVRLGDVTCVLRVLNALPGTVQTIRLLGLGLGPNGWLQQCMSTLTSTPRQFMLDLSRNGLDDKDIDAFALDSSSTDPKACLTGLRLSCNPGITTTGLTRLLSLAADSSGILMNSLDLSECSLGNEGAYVLAEGLQSPALASLQELSLYRVGFDAEAVRRLVSAATKAFELRTINIVANGQHTQRWMENIGCKLVPSLQAMQSLRVLTISCPEAELESADQLFCNSALACRVILVPNELRST
eukprot:TRINITY_DN8353_c0_g3_i2.p1 TRINITY_DN8353_c0_g3~~TRINITY_DN8353_c0_g3_i2.p1  ORF type:complete len:404 (-),score=53.92 TRINITY_DN8353_c0_g3_i2:173-1384(-)